MKKKPKKRLDFLGQTKPAVSNQYKILPPHIGYYKKFPAFSFKYYMDKDKDLSFLRITDCSNFHTMFSNFHKMSKLLWQEIKKAEQFHAHEILDESKIPGRIKSHLNKIGAEDLMPFQFKAFNEKRIVGFFNSEDVFEIVCCDFLHEIYQRPH